MKPATRSSGHDGPVILAITPIIYRRGKGKAVLKSAKRVQVCEACFVKILASDEIDEGISLFAALLESLRNRYSAIIDAEAAK